MRNRVYGIALSSGIAAVALSSVAASANPLSYGNDNYHVRSIFGEVLRDQGNVEESDTGVPAGKERTVVNYATSHAPGTIVVDTPNTFLYYVLPGGKAIRYGIGVGREGFTWSGVKNIERKAEWPDWTPPPEMIARQPYLPRWVAGGPGNPLGARAMYIGGTIYRIHGTNQPQSIGQHVSSGCIRMVNEDVIDLYSRVKVGTKVVVLPDDKRRAAPVASAPTTPSSRNVSYSSYASRTDERPANFGSPFSRLLPSSLY